MQSDIDDVEHSDNYAISCENIAVDSVGVGVELLSMAAKTTRWLVYDPFRIWLC